MKYRILLITFLCGTLASSILRAQDVHFSQFYENNILRNPALTGIFSGDYKAGINYRNQWSNIAVPFVTVLGSAEGRIPLKNEAGDFFSMGLTATYDKAGSISFKSLTSYLAFSYNKAMEDDHRTFLSVGGALGYIQRSVDMTKMTFSNQYNNGIISTAYSETNTYDRLQHFDVGAGISLNSSFGAENSGNYYIGISGYHLARPREAFRKEESFLRLTTRWSGNLGFYTPLSDVAGFVFHANYQWQDPYRELIFGGLLSFTSASRNVEERFTIQAGCFYRLGDAIIPTLKLEHRDLAFTASYDWAMPTRRLYMTNAASYEFSLYVKGMFRHKDKYTACPRFETGYDWSY